MYEEESFQALSSSFSSDFEASMNADMKYLGSMMTGIFFLLTSMVERLQKVGHLKVL